MESIEQRAKSYAKQCRAAVPEICAFDYTSGAKEERILFVEWLEKNAPQVAEKFKADFKVEPTKKYYGDDDGRAE